MKYFRNNIKIKLGIFFTLLILSVSFFMINWYLIDQFRVQLNKQVETIVNIYHNKLTEDVVDSEYLIRTILPLIDELDVPIIITTKQSNGQVSYESINLKEDSLPNNQTIEEIIISMDNVNKPLPIMIVDNEPIIEIHFGDPVIINTIKWIPYIQICFAIFILFLIFLGIKLLLSNEKNYIYAGMSKETAHQLGTPISSLMGWLQLLEKKGSNNKILDSMKNDISILQNISDKFHKIGSKPILTDVNLKIILSDIVKYYKNKLPKTSSTKIRLKVDENIIIKGDEILLRWAFENLIKNSLESISNSNGIVEIICNTEKRNVEILFSDNGLGILRKNQSEIFNAGFSTKNRGWGIGLNLTLRIINQIHNGSLKLVSSNTKKTTFQILLKLSTS